MANGVSLKVDILRKEQLWICTDWEKQNPSFFEQYVFASVEQSN